MIRPRKTKCDQDNIELTKRHLQKFIYGALLRTYVLDHVTPPALKVCNYSIMASSLENLETQLEMFIENVRQIRIIVSDFQPQGQNVLNQKIQALVHGLQEVDKLKSQVQDVHVPLEVFDYIDQGRNPQLYTKDCIEKALAKNEQVKGKIDAYRKFKANMMVELSRTFPNELHKYRAIRGDE